MTLPGRSACVLVAAAALAAAAPAACSPTNDEVILGMLRTQLAAQYHECVPLGWSPVAVAGTYYPGTTVTLYEEGVWLPARWIGRVRTRDLARRDVRAISDVLNELARAGMLVREKTSAGSRYHLAAAAQPFFYDDSDYGNNPDHIPYLCYSTIVPQRVLSTDSVRRARLRYGSRDEDMFHATFAWTPSPIAGWANDAFLRSHSVMLGPAESPVTVTLAKRHGEWMIAELSAPTPVARIVDTAAWPQPRL
jgi:hypothetical protein